MPLLLRRIALPLLIAVAAAGLLSLAYLAPQQRQAQPPTPSPDLMVTRIAYVGTDGHIYTIAPDGSGRRRVSHEPVSRSASLLPAPSRQATAAVYGWPTWSPDATRLAFSAALQLPSHQVNLAVFVADLEEETSTQVFTNPTGSLLPIAFEPLIPHYLLWSPDGQYLTILAGSPQGVTMYLARSGSQEVLGPALVGAPIYHSWSPEGGRMVIHHQRRHYLWDVATAPEPQLLPATSLAYRAPAWSPDGQQMVLIDGTGDDGAVLVAQADGEGQRAVAPVKGEHAFLWAPQGNLLAITGGRSGPGFYPGLFLLDTQSLERRTITEAAVLAFFWSPNGRRTAYVAEDRPRLALNWWVYEVDTGERRFLATMRHSSDQNGVLLFFDQYAYSHSPWSPDSRHLVLSGGIVGGSTSGEVPGEPRIIILDVAGEEPPRTIARGVLAVWSSK